MSIQSKIKYPSNGKQYEKKLKIPTIIKFSEIDEAVFTKDMVLATVEIDTDNTAYILIPKSQSQSV